jgi:hypothetical protein
MKVRQGDLLSLGGHPCPPTARYLSWSGIVVSDDRDARSASKKDQQMLIDRRKKRPPVIRPCGIEFPVKAAPTSNWAGKNATKLLPKFGRK